MPLFVVQFELILAASAWNEWDIAGDPKVVAQRQSSLMLLLTSLMTGNQLLKRLEKCQSKT